jgi:hypothetical protein
MVQLSATRRYFVSQSSEFSALTLYVSSQRVFIFAVVYLSPETSGYTLVCLFIARAGLNFNKENHLLLKLRSQHD